MTAVMLHGTELMHVVRAKAAGWLRIVCRSTRSVGVQTHRWAVSHDQHESVRRKVALRLRTESGRKTYERRAHLAETPNGFAREVLGLRPFLLRGLDKIRTESLWASCTVFNSTTPTHYE